MENVSSVRFLKTNVRLETDRLLGLFRDRCSGCRSTVSAERGYVGLLMAGCVDDATLCIQVFMSYLNSSTTRYLVNQVD